MNKRLFVLLIIAAAVTGAVVWIWAVTSDTGIGGDDKSIQEETSDAILSGRVVDAAGRPVPGANVFAGAAHTRAGDDGRFSFSDLPAETTPVEATADGHSRAGADELGRPVVDLTTGEPVDDLQLVLPRSATLSGRVVAGGQPVPDAEISLSYQFAEGLDGNRLDPFTVSELTHTSSNGTFSLSDIAPGRLQIFVDTEDHGFAESDEIYIRQGQRRDDLTIDVAPTGTLYGTIFDGEGNPVSASLTLEPENLELRTERSRSDADGQYRFSSLSEGRYSLVVEAEDGLAEVVDDIYIRPDHVEEVDVILEGELAIYGRVVDTYGEPVSDAHVIIHNGDDRRLRVGDDGRFRMEDVDPEAGPWTAVASGPGHEASDERVVEPGRKELFQISAGGIVEGRVISPDGDPVEGARIAISYAESADDIHYHARHIRRETHTNSDGEFELGPLRSGRYRLAADADGYTRATSNPVPVSAGSTSGPITLRLESGASMSGFVRDADTDEPIAAAQIVVANPVPRGRPPTVRTNDNGYYEFDSLPSGRHTLHVSHNLYDFEYIGGIELREGRHLDFDVDLDPVDPENPGQNVQGIGASLESTDGGFRVTAAHPSSPAEMAGIREDDVIIAIDGQSADNLTLDMAVQLIRGEPGEAVTLRVRRSGRGTRTVDVERDRVFIPQQDRQVRRQVR